VLKNICVTKDKIMSFLSKIFPKKKAPKNVYRDEATAVSSSDGKSGVARYLESQISINNTSGTSSKKLSRVDEYLQARNTDEVELTREEKNAINTRVNAKIELRQSEESLMSAEDEELSGVAKYVESQNQINAAQQEEQKLTGVAKYLAEVTSSKPATTGVSKYLSNRVDAKVSSVDRYVISKSLADKNKPKVVILPDSSVTKYLENKPTMLTSRVAKYLAKKVVSDKQAAA